VIPAVAGAIAWVDSRRAFDRLESSFREWRRHIGRVPSYRPLRAGEAASAELEYLTRELAGLGLAAVGDRVEETSDTVVRCFADAPRTTVAVFSFLREASGALRSFTADRTIVTRMTRWPRFARPPDVDGDDVLPGSSIADTLALHRKRVEDVTGLVVAGDVDDIIATFERHRARALAWREAQPPDELLDADLRAFLGPHWYRRTGASLARRLRQSVPVATVSRGRRDRTRASTHPPPA
jgi:hypothetical protein